MVCHRICQVHGYLIPECGICLSLCQILYPCVYISVKMLYVSAFICENPMISLFVYFAKVEDSFEFAINVVLLGPAVCLQTRSSGAIFMKGLIHIVFLTFVYQ